MVGVSVLVSAASVLPAQAIGAMPVVSSTSAITTIAGNGVGAVTGIITTGAGTGLAAFSGDGGPATAAGMNTPSESPSTLSATSFSLTQPTTESAGSIPPQASSRQSPETASQATPATVG